MGPKELPATPKGKNSVKGFTLIEVVMALSIAAVVFGGIITAYIQASRHAEWTGYSLAAQAVAIQQLEQARSSIWDPAMSTKRNDVTNVVLFNKKQVYNPTAGCFFRVTGYSTNQLDVPIVAGGSPTIATNYVTISMMTNFYGRGPQIQVVQVDCVWPFVTRFGVRYHTNSIATILAPDNRDPDTL